MRQLEQAAEYDVAALERMLAASGSQQ